MTDEEFEAEWREALRGARITFDRGRVACPACRAPYDAPCDAGCRLRGLSRRHEPCGGCGGDVRLCGCPLGAAWRLASQELADYRAACAAATEGLWDAQGRLADACGAGDVAAAEAARRAIGDLRETLAGYEADRDRAFDDRARAVGSRRAERVTAGRELTDDELLDAAAADREIARCRHQADAAVASVWHAQGRILHWIAEGRSDIVFRWRLVAAYESRRAEVWREACERAFDRRSALRASDRRPGHPARRA